VNAFNQVQLAVAGWAAASGRRVVRHVDCAFRSQRLDRCHCVALVSQVTTFCHATLAVMLAPSAAATPRREARRKNVQAPATNEFFRRQVDFFNFIAAAVRGSR
jgi:hypothetical protein